MTKIKYSFSTVDFKTSNRVINELNRENYDSNSKKNNVKNITTDIKVLLFDENDRKYLIITADLIWFSDKLTNEIKSKLNKLFFIRKEDIFLCASHTHGSLQTDPEFKFGDFDKNYNNLIIKKIIETVKKTILKKTTNYNIKYGEAEIGPISVSRRLYSLTLRRNEPFMRVQNRPNVYNDYPNKIRTISFYSNKKNPDLILFHYTCHPLLDDIGVTGRDYPGYVSDEIETLFENKTKLMFLQGFCGDISPRFIYKPKSIKDAILERLIGTKFHKPTNFQKKYFVDNLKKSILLSISNSKLVSIENIENNNMKINLTDINSKSVNRDLRISYFKISKNIGFIFANAEMLYNFDSKYKDDNISIGYTNGMVGYIAPKKEYKYQGYEINGFLNRFNLKNEFNNNTELKYDIVRQNLVEKKDKIKYYYKTWCDKKYKDWNITYAPKSYNFDNIKKLIDLLDLNKKNKDLADLLKSFTGNYSIIAKKKDIQFSCVDSIRAFPVFYSTKHNEISFDPTLILKNIEFDEKSVIELSMSSYVLSNRTMFKDIYQIRPGEMIFLPKNIKYQYFKFYPTKLSKKNINELSEELDLITNKIIKRVINKYKNKKILVPLSGGLDSRLVLSKLVQLGCQNLEAVTYGVDDNGELKIAEEVAKKLNVKWNFIPTNNFESKSVFNSEERKNYWKISSGFCVLPNMQEFHLLSNLKKNKAIDNYDVIVNGQAGDFITGGHVNKIFRNKLINKSIFSKLIIEKHFNLWSQLINKKNLNLIKEQIENNLKFFLNEKNKSSLNAYDAQLWEWSERQSKFVSNQQRIYEFYDLDWYLPLWDREYIDFWINCPKEYLIDQKLYKHYLESWDYKNLFTDIKLKRLINPWIGNKRIFIIIANIIKYLSNSNSKEKFYKYVKYFNHYSNHYHSYNFKYFLKRAGYIRNHTSLNVETYINENVPDEKNFNIF